jgi:hypothetical protein
MKALALLASSLFLSAGAMQAADPHFPTSATELKEFLSGTSWNIVSDARDSKVTDTFTFHSNGTFTHKGKPGKWSVQDARHFKIWNYDPAVFNADFTEFTAKNYLGTSYHGVLKKP